VEVNGTGAFIRMMRRMGLVFLQCTCKYLLRIDYDIYDKSPGESTSIAFK
jgi:hypothetical protein